MTDLVDIIKELKKHGQKDKQDDLIKFCESMYIST